MPGNNVEASIPVKDERNGERMSVRGKFAGMLKYLNPFSTVPPLPPPPQDEDTPAAKRPRLQASTSISTVEDTVAVGSTYAVPVAASLPSTGTLRASIPRRAKIPWLEASTTGSIYAAEDSDADSDAHTTGILTRRAKRPRLEAPTDAVASNRAYTPRRKWTPEEDAKLIKARKKHGTKWKVIAALVPGRTKDHCKHRFYDHFDPTIDQTTARKGPWIPEEDAKLTDAVKNHGSNWVAIATFVPSRTKAQCISRWKSVLGVTVKEGKWTGEEDAKLTDAVKKHGGNNWFAVAALVPGRTNQQCRQRWIRSLDPGTRRGKWTGEEDAKLTAAVKKHGCSCWITVAALVPGRTNQGCHRRWLQSLDPDINRGKWTEEEDAMLTHAVKEQGSISWGAVSALVPSRTNDQCRLRWPHLDPDRSTNAADEEHDVSDDEERDWL
jgi:hypothetical protein